MFPRDLMARMTTTRRASTGTGRQGRGTVCARACGECVRVHWYTSSRQSGDERPSGQGGGCGVVCTDTLVHFEQTART